MTKMTPEIWSKPFAFKPISGQSKPFAHQKCGTHISVKWKNLANLFAHILSNDLQASQIPLASFEGWDFGPKIGLDGLHGLAQVWTPLPLEVVYDKLLVRPTSEAETLCCWRGMTR